MPFWKKLKNLFGGGKGAGAEAASGEDAPIGRDEPCHFTITFRHSSKSIDFEGTWRGIGKMSGRFADSRGLKMNNFYVPWDEVAFIYCGGRVADDAKEGKKEGEVPSEAKPGDEVPATGAAKALGAETMEILPGEGEAGPKADEAKPAETTATRDVEVGEVEAEAGAGPEAVTAEEIG